LDGLLFEEKAISKHTASYLSAQDSRFFSGWQKQDFNLNPTASSLMRRVSMSIVVSMRMRGT
jgi:hypothetical protein